LLITASNSVPVMNSTKSMRNVSYTFAPFLPETQQSVVSRQSSRRSLSLSLSLSLFKESLPSPPPDM
jgi:hypothetical protein